MRFDPNSSEYVQAMITASLRSVDVVNNLSELSNLTEMQTKEFDRNISHLEIMLTKEWFSNGLTPEQLGLIQLALAKK